MNTHASYLLDLSNLSPCYYGEPGSNFGVGRVAAGFAVPLAEAYGNQLGFSSAFFSAELTLYLDREFPELTKYAIEGSPTPWERWAIQFVDIGDPSGGIRTDVWSKVKRKIWRYYDDNLRWKRNAETERIYREAKLIHSELGMIGGDRCPSAKRIYTIHDLMPVRQHRPGTRAHDQMASELRKEYDAGCHFCCVSQYTADDLMEFLGTKGDRIQATSLGLDPVFQPTDDRDLLEHWRNRLGLSPDQKYVIAHTGGIERKNLIGIIETIHALRQEAFPDLMLVFAGYPKRLHLEFEQKVSKSIQWRDFVRFTGSLKDTDFPPLFAGAELMLFLSWAEGFGLPPLEAMGCGCPVVCSNRTSLPEVVGDAGLLVDPSDRAEVVAAVHKVLLDPNLREDLRKRGLKRAEEFRWDVIGQRVKSIWDNSLALS